ncbi:MAG: DNA repair protein RecO [Planctomycetaceae bacterium]
MSSEKTDAIVIRLADFSETSRVATLFTREFGKIGALAKGAKRLRSAFEAALDLLAVCRIVFLRKSSATLDLLTEAQLISRFRPHGRSLGCLYGGYYVAELLDGLTEDYDPHPALYDEAAATLERLAAQDEFRLPVLRFELVVLREIGQLPTLDQCVSCGTAVENQGPYRFWVSGGGLICRKCQKEHFSSPSIQAGTAAVMRRLAGDSPEVLDRLAVSPAQVREMRALLTPAISHALGRRPKMLRYLAF